MAGLGYKDFADGAVATAAEADGYFMQQTVMRFSSTSARDSALGGILADGLMAFTVDFGILWMYYSGAWRVVQTALAVAVDSSEPTSGTTTSTTYTATLTGGTACGVVFIPPASGSVMVINNCELSNSGANVTRCGFVVRTGGSIGTGTVIAAASDARAIRTDGTTTGVIRTACTHIVTGLIPGSTYNAQQVFAVSAGTGTYLNKNLAVIPVP
jgi:hypothetical protein